MAEPVAQCEACGGEDTVVSGLVYPAECLACGYEPGTAVEPEECHTPEVRYVQSSDQAVSGDNIS